MKSYYVRYRMYQSDDVHGINIVAANKEDAYDKAVYEAISKKEGALPYSAWVDSVTYSNGKQKFFNTHEGKPY